MSRVFEKKAVLSGHPLPGEETCVSLLNGPLPATYCFCTQLIKPTSVRTDAARLLTNIQTKEQEDLAKASAVKKNIHGLHIPLCAHFRRRFLCIKKKKES